MCVCARAHMFMRVSAFMSVLVCACVCMIVCHFENYCSLTSLRLQNSPSTWLFPVLLWPDTSQESGFEGKALPEWT